ncbi:DUF4430 domain-containing protein [Desulfoscipio sp. XC116]|uniref:DUF4430 domain-containing protein n=1 Tax=Desulfoscipio sp. XC116 TaxID=3144975 RepID=UPI00325BA9C3
MRKTITKRSLVIFLALVFALSLGAVPAFADVDKPESSTPVTISEVMSISIGGKAAVFQEDDNGPTKFIRADLDTEYDLQGANIVINLKSASTTVSSNTLTFIGDGTTTRTASNVNLLNEAYDVKIGDTEYVLAADLPNGTTVSVSPSDPLKVENVVFTTSPSVDAAVEGTSTDRFAGNPWYEQEDFKWTIIKYYVRGNKPLPSGTNLSAVPGTMTLAGGASASGCVSGSYTFDLDQNLNVMTVTNGGASRDYHVSARLPEQIKVYYDIVLDEIENDETYYTGEIIDQCEEINAATEAYFDTDGFYVDPGTTVMKIMVDFADWAEEEGYFSDPTTISYGGAYLAELNGLAEFDGGYLSGWMYMDDVYTPTCKVPGVGAADYQLTTDNTIINWFYTTDYTPHFDF